MMEKKLIIALIAVVPILIIQGTWIFIDAKKRGERHYWLWGLFGIIHVPFSLIIYLVVTRILYEKNK